LKAPDNIYRLLDGTANRQTSLTVNDKPSMDGACHVSSFQWRLNKLCARARGSNRIVVC